MKVIILAAGEGTRLGHLTSQNPKCLIELFGKSLLQWQVELFRRYDINDITIVKGYLEKKIRFRKLWQIYHPTDFCVMIILIDDDDDDDGVKAKAKALL